MTTIILTIIGILLAAAAALMVIFYGGDAFNSGSIGAEANTYQNAGTNVISAFQLALANGDGATFDLTSTEYLSEPPSLPAGANAIILENPGTGELIYSVSLSPVNEDTVDQVCARINENLRNGVNTVVDGVPTAPSGRSPNVVMQCANNTFTASL